MKKFNPANGTDSGDRSAGDQAAKRSTKIKFLAVLALILCLPSAYFLWAWPPLWRDSDGFYQVTGKPSYLTLLHWPPLYCLTARIPIWLGNLISGQYPGKSVLTNSGVEALVLFQQAMLVLVLCFACLSITKRPLLRVLIGGLFALTPWLYAFANCVGSEAYSNVFVLLAAVCGWRVVKNPGSNSRELLGWLGALAGAILSRHINAVLAFLLPGAWLFALLLERVWRVFDRRPLTFRWKTFLSLAGLSLATIVSCQLLTYAFCEVYKVPFRSRVGYVFQWRLGYLGSLSPEQRNQRLEWVAKRINHPSLTYAVGQVELALGDRPGWQPELLSQSIYNWFQSNTRESFGQRSTATDGLLNEIAKEFLWSGDHALYQQIGHDFLASLQFTPQDITKEPFLATDWLKNHLADPVFLAVTTLRTFQDPGSRPVEWFDGSPYCQLGRGIPLWIIGSCGLGLAIGLTIRKSSAVFLLRYCYASFLVITGLILCLVNCSLTFLAPRFAPSMAILFLVAFCISLSELADIFYTGDQRNKLL